MNDATLLQKQRSNRAALCLGAVHSERGRVVGLWHFVGETNEDTGNLPLSPFTAFRNNYQFKTIAHLAERLPRHIAHTSRKTICEWGQMTQNWEFYVMP